MVPRRRIIVITLLLIAVFTGMPLPGNTISYAFTEDFSGGDLVIDANYSGFAMANDGLPDIFTVQLMDTQLEIYLNGAPIFSESASNVDSLELIGSNDDDTLTIVETVYGLPVFAGDLSADGGVSGTAHTNAQLLLGTSPANIGVHIDGGGGINSLNLLLINTGNDLAYYADDLTPSKSGNVGIGDEVSLSFANLTPITFVSAGGTLLIDATSTPATSLMTLSDSGGAGDGVNIVTGDGGLENVTFSGFSSLAVLSGDGSETITEASLDAADPDGAGPGVALTAISLSGDNLTASDSGSDTINLQDLPSTITAMLVGGSGSDLFNIGSSTNSLGSILGNVTVDGGAHNFGTTGLTIKSDTNTLDTGDILSLNDQGDAGGYTYALDATTSTRTGTGTITYVTIETLHLNTSAGAASLNVTTTSAGINTTLTTQDAADAIVITTTGADSNVVINSVGGADTVNLVTTGGDGPDGDTMGSFTQVNSGDDNDTITANAVGSLAIYAGAGGDAIYKVGPGSGIPAALVFDGEGGADAIYINGVITTNGIDVDLFAETVFINGILGPAGVGMFTVNGNLIFNTGSTFAPKLTGTTSGGSHDQLDVTGSVTIEAGVTLNLDTATYSQNSGTITLITNDAADAVTGTFDGLIEGAQINPGGTPNFLIYYAGGDGNDIVLTSATPAALTFSSFGLQLSNIWMTVVPFVIVIGTVWVLYRKRRQESG